jgi:alpha-ribazole phosphatase
MKSQLPPRLILVRHGKTAWNQQGRFLGRTDQGLDEIGHRQALQVAEVLGPEKIGAIFSSTLARAWQTAQYIADSHHLPVQRLEELMEMDFGLWEGMTFNEIQSAYPEVLKLWIHNPLDIRVPGGETAAEVWQRIESAWQKIASESDPGLSIVVVAHGGTIRFLANLLTGVPAAEQWFYNPAHGEIMVLEKDLENETEIIKSKAPYRFRPYFYQGICEGARL